MQRLIENGQMRGAEKATYALLYLLHQQNPRQDRKIGNISIGEPFWGVLHALGHS